MSSFVQNNHLAIKTYNNFNYHLALNENESKHMNTESDIFSSRLQKNMKELILNGKKYNSYIKKYTDLTQEYSFKIPQYDDYPIKKNEDFIKIGETIQTNSSSFYLTSSSFRKQRPFSSNLKSFPHITNDYSTSRNGKIGKKFIDFEPLYSLINNEKEKEKEKIMDNYDGVLSQKNKEKFIDILFNFCVSMPKLKDHFFKKESNSFIKAKTDIGYYETQLICESLCLKFKNINLKKEHYLYFPFYYMPLYYLLSFHNFKLFVSNTIKYDYDKREFIFNDYEMKNVIYCFFKLIKKKFKDIEYMKNINYNVNENTFKLKYDWIVNQEEDDMGLYEVEIILPNIKFIINELKTSFIKTLPKNLLIELLSNSFENWDKMLNQELNLTLTFRNIINEITNNKIENHINQIYNLSEHTFHSNKNEYTFFFTDNLNNSYYQLVTFYTVLILYGEKFQFFKKFILNYSETKNLKKMNKVWSDVETINKCLFMNRSNGELILKLDLLSNIDDKFIEIIKKSGFEIKSENKKVIKFKSEHFKIEVLNPFFSNQLIENNGIIKKMNYQFPNSVLKNLLSSDYNDFSKIIYQAKDKIELAKSFSINDIENEFLDEEKRNEFFKSNPNFEKIMLKKRFTKQPSFIKKNIGKYQKTPTLKNSAHKSFLFSQKK